jgi:hypothetical protein
MEMVLQQVTWSQMMSLLDGFFGYNKIKVKRIDRYKTTFITRWGTFAYERMPFGLYNVGATFQRVMQIDFDDLIDELSKYILMIWLSIQRIDWITLVISGNFSRNVKKSAFP